LRGEALHTAQGNVSVRHLFYIELEHAVDPRATDRAITGELYHLVQNCKPVTVLPNYDAPNHRRECFLIDNSFGVSVYRITVPCISDEEIERITDVAYNVFYESIEAQGRALLRVPLVRYCSLRLSPSSISRPPIGRQ
jgi:hypothetical protein